MAHPHGRKFGSSEAKRRASYQNTAPKDNNFNPSETGRAILRSYKDAPGEAASKSAAQGNQAMQIADAVRGK